MRKATVRRRGECEVVEADWGTLTWYASQQLGNSSDMTVGECRLKPGAANPLHSHPNCSEVLVVREGTIMHTVQEGEEVQLSSGDVVSIPGNMAHRARNISSEEAVLLIAFSSANRETHGE